MSGPNNYLRLSDLTREIRDVVQQHFTGRMYWIVAEISGHKYYPNTGRHYLSFVEKIGEGGAETAKIKAKAWSQGSDRIRAFEQSTGQSFTDGIQVLVQVSVEYHLVHDLSLTILDVDPTFTLGVLERQRRETLDRLVRDNPGYVEKVGEEYVTYNKRLALRPVVQRIALVASPKSAGYEDFLHTLHENEAGYRFAIDYYYTSVQGAEAEDELVRALIDVYQSKKAYDAVVIIRGGGAKTDFLVFDTYRVSQAVARFPVPVITGIGHHQDVSITDRMAHTQTKTPTQAAEFILARNRSFEQSVLELQGQLVIRAQQLLADHREVLIETQSGIPARTREYLSTCKDLLSDQREQITGLVRERLLSEERELNALVSGLTTTPRLRIAAELQSVMFLKDALPSMLRRRIQDEAARLEHFASLTRLVSPANILKRGYALLEQEGRVLSSVRQLDPDRPLLVRTAEADITTRIETIASHDGKTDL